jgi:hypothetical protein
LTNLPQLDIFKLWICMDMGVGLTLKTKQHRVKKGTCCCLGGHMFHKHFLPISFGRKRLIPLTTHSSWPCWPGAPCISPPILVSRASSTTISATLSLSSRVRAAILDEDGISASDKDCAALLNSTCFTRQREGQ